MKINFKKFPIYTSIRKDMVVEQDISFVLANGIYCNIAGVMAHSLSLRIYETDGEVELTEKEVAALKEWAELFVGLISDSIKDYIAKKQ